MRASTLAMALLATTLVAGAALAQNATQNTTINNNPPPSGGTPQVHVNNPTPVVNVNTGPQESTGFVGLDATTVIILVVIGVLLIALVVGLVGRDRWW